MPALARAAFPNIVIPGRYGIQRPRGPFVLNKTSLQAEGLLAWWPMPDQTQTYFDYGPTRLHEAGLDQKLALGVAKDVNHFLQGDSTNLLTVRKDNLFTSIPQTYDFAISCWARASSAVNDRPAISFDGTDDLIFYPYDNVAPGTRLFWRDITAGSGFTAGHSFAGDGLFHHFLFVSYASDDHRLFLDGVQSATNTETGTAGPFSSFDLFGWAGSASQRFHGEATDFRLYDVAPQPSVIYQMWAPGTRWQLYYELGQVFYSLPAAAVAFVPYPNPRYALTGGMQPMDGGV